MAEHQNSNEQDFELRRRLRALDVGRDPAQDLWPGIARRLDHVAVPVVAPRAARRRRPVWSTWAAVAASVLGVAVLAGFWPSSMQAPAPIADAPGVAGEVVAGSRSLRIQAQAMTVEYQAALNEVDAGQLPLPLQAAAAELDRSALQIRDAMSRDPQSSFLLERLRGVYAQRLRLSQRGLLT